VRRRRSLRRPRARGGADRPHDRRSPPYAASPPCAIISNKCSMCSENPRACSPGGTGVRGTAGCFPAARLGGRGRSVEPPCGRPCGQRGDAAPARRDGVGTVLWTACGQLSAFNDHGSSDGVMRLWTTLSSRHAGSLFRSACRRNRGVVHTARSQGRSATATQPDRAQGDGAAHTGA
jgi:hypothetical protein